jgi:predicted DNA-binding transcriptional regulator AlpA
MTQHDSLLRLTDVATMLSISPGSVRRLVKLGVLPRTEFSARAHRFRHSDVRAALRMLTTGGSLLDGAGTEGGSRILGCVERPVTERPTIKNSNVVRKPTIAPGPIQQ